MHHIFLFVFIFYTYINTLYTSIYSLHNSRLPTPDSELPTISPLLFLLVPNRFGERIQSLPQFFAAQRQDLSSKT